MLWEKEPSDEDLRKIEDNDENFWEVYDEWIDDYAANSEEYDGIWSNPATHLMVKLNQIKRIFINNYLDIPDEIDEMEEIINLIGRGG